MQVYVCAKCGEVTDLDNSSVIELQRIYSQLKVLVCLFRARRDMITARVKVQLLMLIEITKQVVETVKLK
jgi:DNA-directed RNA polymerase subunit RPC12/RpoP